MQQNTSYVVPSYPQLNQKKNNAPNQQMVPNQQMIPNKMNLNQSNTKHLLFFSQYCNHSKSLLNELNTKNQLDKVELICIDQRFIKDNITYIILPNQQNMPLPPMIQSVPTLCILPNHEILKGMQILHYFVPISKSLDEERSQLNIEPNPFSIQKETTGTYGVSSDHFSFWDSNEDELSASGNGGTKQMYDYVSVSNPNEEQIYTPQEQTDSKPNISLDALQQQRMNEI